MTENQFTLNEYTTEIAAGGHWSLMLRRGVQMRITTKAAGSNVGMLMYNPIWLNEKYNAPDTLKCQHTFKLTKGHCLYSDMGRIFCSVIDDSFGWHDTLCGNSTADDIQQKWGKRDYQQHRNQWRQNGYDSFLVELTKYGLGKQAMAANVNWFSKVVASDDGELTLAQSADAGDYVTLRFEMDTLVLLHNCPHPLNDAAEYPCGAVSIELSQAEPVKADDYCMNACPENQRGFQNNALYHLGGKSC